MSQFVALRSYELAQRHVATGSKHAAQPIATQGQFASHSYRTAGTAGILLIPACFLAYATTSSSYFQQKTGSNVPVHEFKIATSAREIEFIRDAFKLSMTELARLMTVSRQALYDWLKGARLSDEHAVRVSALAKATQILASTGVPIAPAVLRRAVNGGPSLAATAQARGDLTSVATALAETLKREYQQQQLLASRLSNRKAPAFEPGQYGSPHPNERG